MKRFLKCLNIRQFIFSILALIIVFSSTTQAKNSNSISGVVESITDFENGLEVKISGYKQYYLISNLASFSDEEADLIRDSKKMKKKIKLILRQREIIKVYPINKQGSGAKK